MRALPLLPLLLLGGCGAPTPRATVPTDVASIPAPAEAGASRPVADPALWTLRDCLDRARCANAGLEQAELRARETATLVTQARSFLLPHLDGQGRWSTRSNDPGALAGGVAMITGERSITDLGVVASMTLTTFGQAENRLRQARHLVAAERAQADQARLLLGEAVAEGVLTLLEAREAIALAEESLAALRRQFTDTQARLEQGLVGRDEVLAAAVRTAEREQHLLRARHGEDLAVAGLNRLLGRRLDAPLAVAEPAGLERVPADLAGLTAWAAAHSPRLGAVRSETAAAQAELASLRAGHLPTLSADAGYYHTSNDYVLEDGWFAGGLTVQVPLFAGGLTTARADEARLRLLRRQAAEREAREALELDLRRTWLSAGEAQAEIRLADQGVLLAAERLRLMQERFAQGLTSASEVLDEEERHTRMRYERSRSRHRLRLALIALRRACGLDADQPLPETQP